MNLAYLNLPIFSFMKVVSQGVSDFLKPMGPGTTKAITDAQWYKDAQSIAQIHTLESFTLGAGQPKWVRFKSWPVALLFNILFYYRVGKAVAILSAAYCCCMIILAVAAELKAEFWLCQAANAIGAPFWPTVFAFVWPVICVSAGAFVRQVTMRDLHYNLNHLTQSVMSGVDAAVRETEKITQQKPKPSPRSTGKPQA